jgi:hypothetical protein
MGLFTTASGRKTEELMSRNKALSETITKSDSPGSLDMTEGHSAPLAELR